MRRYRINSILVLPTLILSLLLAGCGEDGGGGTPTPSSRGINGHDHPPSMYVESIDLFRDSFSADLPISTTAVLTGFEPGELIEVTLTASDGSALVIGIATANEGWMAAVDIEHDGLPEGVYVIEAASETGGRATTPLFVK